MRPFETVRDLTSLNFWYFGLKLFVDRLKPVPIKNFFHTLQLLPYQIKPISGGLVQCRTPEGLMFVYRRDELEWRPELGDPHRYHRFREASKGDVILDVGAHIGSLTIRDAKRVGDTGLVVSIEPLPTSYKIIKENILLNELKNVIPLNLALTDYNGTAQFKITEHPEGSFLANMGPCSRPKICRVITVPVKKIDDIVDELALDKIDFIKIDAEGAELAILRGARKTLHENDVHLAIASYHTAQEVHEVSSYLVANEFRVFVSQDSIVYSFKD